MPKCIEADGLVLASPLFNYGVSQLTKVWLDLSIADERLRPGTTELAGKPAVIITAHGGSYAAGTTREGWDHSTGYLQRMLRDYYGMNVHTILIELTRQALPVALDGLGRP